MPIYQSVETEQFYERIRAERDRGFGFVPLLGTGISAPSGIPIVRELESYLASCVAQALGIESPAGRRWHPRTDNWPPLCITNVDWLARMETMLRKERDLDARSPDVRVLQEAIGALADWRTAIQLLARIDHTPDERVYLRGVDHDVIDTFFLHVVANKRPTLAHRMLNRLADVLRFKCVLTTNFDDLMEQAYEEVGISLTPFDVHLAAGLPPHSVVSAQQSLIKLHGGRYGLRTDFSLDTSPSSEDLRYFASYLCDSPISEGQWEQLRRAEWERQDSDARLNKTAVERGAKARNHLLVAGFSGSDRRIMQMIKYAHKRVGCRIFWIAYSELDVRQIAEFCKENRIRVATSRSESGVADCMIVRHRFVGMMFLELYQVLTQSTPYAQAIFPSVSRLAVPPLSLTIAESSQSTRKEASRLIAQQSDSLVYINTVLDGISDANRQGAFLKLRLQLRKRLDLLTKTPPDFRRFVVVSSKDGHKGVTTIASSVFYQEMDAGTQCIWLDMDDVAGTDDLFEQMLDAIARKQGVQDWLPVLLERDSRNGHGKVDRRATEVGRLTSVNSRRWIIFLNARDAAGATSHDTKRTESARDKMGRNGWLDVKKLSQEDDADDTADAESFIELIDVLTREYCPQVTCVLLCHHDSVIDPISETITDDTRSSTTDSNDNTNDVAPLIKELENARLCVSANSPDWEPENDRAELALQEPCLDFTHQAVAASVSKWIREDEKGGKLVRANQVARVKFLLALVSAKRTRYPALLWSSAFHGHNEPDRVQKTNEWIKQLADLKAVRVKDGGFIWLRHETLRLLKEMLLRSESKLCLEETSPINRGIGEWYHNLFLSSDDPLAAFEAVNHLLRASVASIDYYRLLSNNPDADSRSGSLIGALRQIKYATRILVVAKGAVLCSGFSKISCRRLSAIRDESTDEVLSALGTSASKLAKRWGIKNSKRRNPPAEFKKKMTRAIFEMRCEAARLMSEIAREVSEHRTAFRRQRQLRELLCTQTLATARSGTLDQNTRRELRKEFRDNPKHAAQYCEWEMEVATLCISTRSYNDAQLHLLRIYQCLNRATAQKNPPWKLQWTDLSWDDSKKTILPIAEVKQLVEAFSTRIQLHLHNNVDATEWIVSTAIKLVLRHMQLTIVQAQACLLAARIETENDRAKGEKEKLAKAYFELTEELYRLYNQIQKLSVSDHHSQHYFWRQLAKTQLSTAVAAGRRDFDEAHRRITEARTSLRLCRPDMRSFAEGIIELHLAEINLYRCVTSGNASELDRGEFYKMRAMAFRLFGDRDSQIANPHGNASDWRARLMSVRSSADGEFASQIRHLESVANGLSKAESRLRSNRKNVWWVTWYYELRLRHAEFVLFSTILDKDKPVPILGIECAPANTATEIDNCLDNAVRLVRLDPIRLANCIRSYANCMRALFLRCVLDEGVTGLSSRQDQMRVNITSAIDRLEWIVSVRKNEKQPPYPTREVLAWVEFVIKDARSACIQATPVPR